MFQSNYQANQVITAIVRLSLLIFLLLAWLVTQYSTSITPWESQILLTIHSQSLPILDQLALLTTDLGDLTGIAILSLLMIIFLVYQQKWLFLTFFLSNIFSSALLNLIAKHIFRRIRPELWDLLYLPKSFSFPSGHAMGSMSLVIAILWLTRGTIWYDISLIWGSIYLLLIAWTRLYLGVHYPTDIIGGWLLAIFWTNSLYYLITYRLTRNSSLV